MPKPNEKPVFTLSLKNIQQALAVAYESPLINKTSLTRANDYVFGTSIVLGHDDRTVEYTVKSEADNQYRLYHFKNPTEMIFKDEPAARAYVRELYDRSQIMRDLFGSHQFRNANSVWKYAYLAEDGEEGGYVKIFSTPEGENVILPLGEDYPVVEKDLHDNFFKGELLNTDQSNNQNDQYKNEKTDESIYWHKTAQGVLVGKSYATFKEVISDGKGFAVMTSNEDRKTLQFSANENSLNLHEEFPLAHISYKANGEAVSTQSTEMALITDTSIDLKTSAVTVNKAELEFYDYTALFNYMLANPNEFSPVQVAQINYNHEVAQYDEQQSIVQTSFPSFFDRILNVLGIKTEAYKEYEQQTEKLTQNARQVAEAAANLNSVTEKSVYQNTYEHTLKELGLADQPIPELDNVKMKTALEAIVSARYDQVMGDYVEIIKGGASLSSFPKQLAPLLVNDLFKQLSLASMSDEQKQELKDYCFEIVSVPKADRDIVEENVEIIAGFLLSVNKDAAKLLVEKQPYVPVLPAAANQPGAGEDSTPEPQEPHHITYSR